jgi:hypothetical protein
MTEENKAVKTAKISVDLNEAREKHLAISLPPVNLVNLAGIPGTTYMKLQAGNLSDVNLKLVDAESMGFLAVVADSPASLKASLESLKSVVNSVTTNMFSEIFTSDENDHGPDKFYRDIYRIARRVFLDHF